MASVSFGTGSSSSMDESMSGDRDSSGQFDSKPFLRLPQLIDGLAKEGQCIIWDDVRKWYLVTDGPSFEMKFNALRCVRGKRRDDAVDRPFARMHVHFVLCKGDKWAGTGSIFRPKVAMPAPRQHPMWSATMQNSSDLKSEDSVAMLPIKRMKTESAESEGSSCIVSGVGSEGDQDSWYYPDGDDFITNQMYMRLPVLIDRLSQEGQAVVWSEAQNWYEVVDGDLFQEKFNALRLKRGKRNGEAQERPFARMHIHFILCRGDKWARTGSAFRPKTGRRPVTDSDGRENRSETPFTNSLETLPPLAAQPIGPPFHFPEANPVNVAMAYQAQNVTAAAPWCEQQNSFHPVATNCAPGPSICVDTNFESSFHMLNQHIPPVEHPSGITADMVKIDLRCPGAGSDSFQCTLQHFLDVTGAGELFARSASRNRFGENLAKSEASVRLPVGVQGCEATFDSSSSYYGSPSTQYDSGSTHSTSESPSSPVDMAPDCGEPSRLGPQDRMISGGDIAGILGNIWHENSLGDQAYFFYRQEGCTPFFNGAIVSLMDGKLTTAVCAPDSTSSMPQPMYMVVSDNNAKWKGEPIPTTEQEKLGHWCAFLGQVPVTVRGPVRCGDFIGPAGDGSGYGVVTSLGKGPVVGIALLSKEDEEPGVVRTLCFAGFSALAPQGGGVELQRVLEQARRVEESVGTLKRDVEECGRGLAAVCEMLDKGEGGWRRLEARVEQIESVTARMATMSANGVITGVKVGDGQEGVPIVVGQPVEQAVVMEPQAPTGAKGIACFGRNRFAAGMAIGIAAMVMVGTALAGYRRAHRQTYSGRHDFAKRFGAFTAPGGGGFGNAMQGPMLPRPSGVDGPFSGPAGGAMGGPTGGPMGGPMGGQLGGQLGVQMGGSMPAGGPTGGPMGEPMIGSMVGSMTQNDGSSNAGTGGSRSGGNFRGYWAWKRGEWAKRQAKSSTDAGDAAGAVQAAPPQSADAPPQQAVSPQMPAAGAASGPDGMPSVSPNDAGVTGPARVGGRG